MESTDSSVWKLFIKHGSQQLEVSIPASATIQKLQEHLQDLTGAFVRKQKLIYKGKVLPHASDLARAGLSDGSKLMLLLSDGTAVATAGQAVLAAQKKARQDEAAQRVRELYDKAKGGSGLVASAVASAAAAATAAARDPAIDWWERKRNWEKTGIVSLRDLGLLGPLPADLFSLGTPTAPQPPPSTASASAQTTTSSTAAATTATTATTPLPYRVADLSYNRFSALPACLTALAGLHTLRLDHNRLESGGLPWGELGRLSSLTCLSLDHNLVGEVPEEGLAGLKDLQVLTLSHNRLACLPRAVGCLGALRELAADGNRLEELPESLGGCSSLETLSAEGNLIRSLPTELSRLTKLRTVRLDSNRISFIPPAVLSDCSSLSALSLQDNPITADQLRATPGFAAYDTRRVARCNKQLEAGVLQHVEAGRAFTEGAEDRQWSRWAGAGGQQGAGGKG